MSALTVIIAAFDAQETVAAAIQSGFRSGASIVLVVDDGSTDLTAEVAERAGATVICQSNSGAAAARRRGASEATTPLIAFLDADDEMIAEGVTQSISMLENDETLVAVGGRVYGISARGESKLLAKTFAEVTTESLLHTGFSAWPPGAAVIRRAAWQQTFKMEPPAVEPRFAEDYETLIRLSMVGAVGRHDFPSLRYRQYGGKSAKSALDAIRCKEQLRHYYADAAGMLIDLLPPSRMVAASYMRTARAKRAEGKWWVAYGYMALAISHRIKGSWRHDAAK